LEILVGRFFIINEPKTNQLSENNIEEDLDELGKFCDPLE
jgi:hypothetical protein